MLVKGATGCYLGSCLWKNQVTWPHVDNDQHFATLWQFPAITMTSSADHLGSKFPVIMVYMHIAISLGGVYDRYQRLEGNSSVSLDLHWFIKAIKNDVSTWSPPNHDILQQRLLMHTLAIKIVVLSMTRLWHLLYDVQSFSIPHYDYSFSGQTKLSAVITRSHIVRYWINNCRKWSRISSGHWIHERHSIPLPIGRAIGCLLLMFSRKLTAL